jgi:hypothetical protein
MSVEHRGRPQLLHLILDVLYADMHDVDDDMLLLTLFGESLELEVQKAADKATFMRDNTALTELMSRYNQREPGREQRRLRSRSGELRFLWSCCCCNR